MGVADLTSERGLTIRQRAVAALKLRMEGMQDDGVDVWRNVYMGDLEDIDNQACPAAAIDFGMEEMLNNTFPCSTYSLPVFLNFRYRGQRGLDEHNAYMYYLGLLQFAMLGEHTLGGLTLDVKEVSNASSIIGIEDTYPGGTLVTEVIYRTRLHNPYNSPSEA